MTMYSMGIVGGGVA